MDGFLLEVRDNTELLNILNLVRPEEEQEAILTISEREFKLFWEHSSKVYQATIFIKSDIFLNFSCGTETYEFGIDCGIFLKTVAAFKGGTNLQLQMQQNKQELLMRMISRRLAIYSPIPILQCTKPDIMSEYMTDKIAEIVFDGPLFKMAVDGCKWTGASITIYLKHIPQTVILSSTGERGKMEIDIPMTALNSFRCRQEEEVLYTYNYASMKMGFCTCPAKRKIFSKIEINSDGLMHITHQLSSTFSTDNIERTARMETREHGNVKACFTIVPVEDENL